MQGINAWVTCVGYPSSNSSASFTSVGRQRNRLGPRWSDWNTTPSQLLTVAGNAVFTGNVGIGTSSPATKLDVYGSGTADPFNVSSSSNISLFRIAANGNVGIGTTTPTQKLDVAGNINISAGSAYMYNGANVITASTTLFNYFFGGAGNLTITGGQNTANGYQDRK